MERLFKSLESEWIPTLGYCSLIEAQRDIEMHLMEHYNRRGPHTVSDGKAPAISEEELN